MSDEVDETTKLKEPTYAKLSGMEKKKSLSNTYKAEEFITFDFMVTLSEHILTENENLQNAIKESVDCEIDQIHDLKITEIDGARNKQCRVNGKIYTDDWELPILQKKFEKIISERVLSGSLQTICDLDDRPMIRRFFCKTSRQQHQKKSGDLDALNQTESLRTLKDDAFKGKKLTITPKSKEKAKVNQSVSYTDDKQNDHDKEHQDEEDKEYSLTPTDQSPLKSQEGNNSSSGSGSSGGGTQCEGDRKHHLTKHLKQRNEDDNPCECFCVVQ